MEDRARESGRAETPQGGRADTGVRWHRPRGTKAENRDNMTDTATDRARESQGWMPKVACSLVEGGAEPQEHGLRAVAQQGALHDHRLVQLQTGKTKDIRECGASRASEDATRQRAGGGQSRTSAGGGNRNDTSGSSNRTVATERVSGRNGSAEGGQSCLDEIRLGRDAGVDEVLVRSRCARRERPVLVQADVKAPVVCVRTGQTPTCVRAFGCTAAAGST